ncbi:MAG TPA: amidohydrolase family protein, partial [Methanocorpusculum sp.]|nr:amidohydrolase family protein [Methanocorpusculum sp.]
MDNIQITGTAFLGADFRPENVELTINNGIITDISPARDNSGRLILPSFFNAHTHIGDTVALDTPIDRPLKELVAPPNGLKHVILRETPNDKLISAMRHSMEFMIRGGTTGFADFREGGADGVSAISSARVPGITSVILGRDGGELMPESAGLGLSNAHRLDSEIEAAAAAKKAGKLVAVHAGEGGIKDIEPA